MEQQKVTPLLSNKQYNILKWLVGIVFPALGTFYGTVGAIWNFPATEQVLGTFAAVTLLIGTLVGVSTKSYNQSGNAFDGEFVIDQTDPEKDLVTVAMEVDPVKLAEQDKVVLKVVSN